ncbi:DegT/DnrJ/EryC1/StrS family aminotransferase [Geodermatophilus sp. SYSU D00691]
MGRDPGSPLRFAAPSIGDDEVAAVVEVLRSGWLTTGPRTAEFECRFADAVGAEAALACSSGTAALHLGLIASGVGPGDVVLTTPLTFCSTVHVVEHQGARPVFVDVDPQTLNISPAALATAVERLDTPPAAIVPVHLAGLPAAVPDILRIAEECGAAVVEDAAHALGADVDGRPVGSTSGGPAVPRSVAFSFYATKNITTGEGGMLTGDAALLERARTWSLHGMTRDAWNRYGAGGSWHYSVTQPGFKYNMSDLQAALGVVQLGRAAEFLDRRRTIARMYDTAFEKVDEIRPVSRATDAGHAWHLYMIRIDPARSPVTRDELAAALAAQGIGTSVHFIPVHRLEYYRERYGYSPEDFPVANSAFEQLLSLPVYPAMTDEDVRDVVEAVLEAVDGSTRG